MSFPIDPVKRFWAKVDRSGKCWLWLGFKNNWGYGQFWYKNRMAKAHRYSFELHFGEPPKDRLILHKCDNPGCVRPDHLFLGTAKDNMQDMIKKGRKKTRGQGSAGPLYGKRLRRRLASAEPESGK